MPRKSVFARHTARCGYMDRHMLHPKKRNPKIILVDDLDKFTKVRSILPGLTQEDRRQLEKELID